MSATLAPAPVRSRPVAPARSRTSTLAVHKFGGAALGTSAGVTNVAVLVARWSARQRLVVVASAAADTTDALLAIARTAAVAPAERVAVEIERLRQLHDELLSAVHHPDELPPLRQLIDESFAELATLAAAARAIGTLGPREVDRVLARGERLSAAVLAAALRSNGVRAEVVDATAILLTDGAFGSATPDLARTTIEARRALLPRARDGVVTVVPGFIGRGADGAVVTLGRGGSDLTATALAAALGARSVVLWKDVVGLHTADPRIVPGARVLPALHVDEAMVLAGAGARVLHPRALVPCGERTRVTVRSFADPDEPGTVISWRRIARRTPVAAIAVAMDQALVRVVGRGLRASPGVLARALGALHEARLDVALVSQAVTGYGLVLVVPSACAASAAERLRTVLAAELACGEVARVEVRAGVATVGVVGDGVGQQPAVGARALGALATERIDLLASAQGAEGACLSLVVDATRAAEAQRAIHDAFGLQHAGDVREVVPAHASVIVLGAGTIGRELLAQLADGRRGDGPRLRVCAVVDSSGYVCEPRGFSRPRLLDLCAHKRGGLPLALARGGVAAGAEEAVVRIAMHRLARPILVDATAADTAPVLERALASGWDVVLANKVPLAGEQDAVDRLWEAARQHGRRVRHEATVGAGLPVIDTLHKLLDAGDRVLRIEGCPSGTLGFLFGELGRGRAFSAALADAVAAGYAEPDPRADLSGMDVARKALILARMIGFRGGLANVAVESLVPESLRDIPLAEFLARVEELDAPWAARIRAARARGQVLRYRVRVTRRAITVGIAAVPLTDRLGVLNGTDNQFAFTTGRYRTQPLVVTGPGAGAAVTAAGVVNDLVQLAGAGGGALRAAEMW